MPAGLSLYLVEVFSLGRCKGKSCALELKCLFPPCPPLLLPLEGRRCTSPQERRSVEIALTPWLTASARCFAALKAGCDKGEGSTELTGSSGFTVVKLLGEGGRRNVGEGAKKYIQGSLYYTSVQLQIALGTEQVVKDVEVWQGKFGVR